MAVPNQIESIVRDELHTLFAKLESEISDPQLRAELMAMAEDAALLPIRIARGENVESLTAALTAEAQNRALHHRIKVQMAVKHAWMIAVARILKVALAVI
jgi:hypothetical protein